MTPNSQFKLNLQDIMKMSVKAEEMKDFGSLITDFQILGHVDAGFFSVLPTIPEWVSRP